MSSISSKLTFAGCLIAAVCGVTRSAEIRLRSEAVPTSTLVTLSDVAKIYAADDAEAERIGRIRLFPAPPAGQRRFLSAREVVDALRLTGENVLDHVVSGASRVTVVGPRPAAPPRAISAVDLERVKNRVRRVVGERLTPGVGNQTAERIDVVMDDPSASALVGAGGELSVVGALQDRAGEQLVTLSYDDAGVERTIQLAVHIDEPERVVVATRSLHRGAVIREGDVTLVARTHARRGTQNGFASIDSVLGMELTRAVAADRPITDSMIRRPRLVQRGDIVTVHSLGQGVRVSLEARAVEDGSAGDLIRVESLADRSAFFARVTGIQQVEVYAQARAVPASPRRTRAGHPTETANAGHSSPRAWIPR